MQQEEKLKYLDELIADLGGCNDADGYSRGLWDLLLEHLQAARRYLLGSMPSEYSLSLQQAQQSVTWIPNKRARTGPRNTLRTLIDSKMPKPRTPTAATTGYALPGSVRPAPAL
jgi:hypothetical protein